jgi:hypothetical protein
MYLAIAIFTLNFSSQKVKKKQALIRSKAKGKEEVE